MSERVLDVRAWEALDSRGNPTVACEVLLEGGGIGHAIAPSGASRGKYEVVELRDQDPRRFHGRGVLKAVENINEVVLPRLRGKTFADPEALDRYLESLDGTPDLSLLGGNALIAVSLAFARAVAATHQIPLYALFSETQAVSHFPVPLFNIINGGMHADNSLTVQEFLVVPSGITDIGDRIRAGCEIYQVLKSILREQGLSVSVGDEGGFAPQLSDTRAALELLMTAIERSGYRPGRDVFLGIDAAASQFATDHGYRFDGAHYSGEQLVDRWLSLCGEYPIIYLEDPMREDAPEDWRLLMEKFQGAKLKARGLLVVADDLTVTNPARVQEYSELANALLVKVNQAGTLRRTLAAVTAATAAGWELIVSHRSGDTEDTFIADLAVGLGAWGLKAGAPARSERTAKYNRLLEIATRTKAPLSPVPQMKPQPQPVIQPRPE